MNWYVLIGILIVFTIIYYSWFYYQFSFKAGSQKSENKDVTITNRVVEHEENLIGNIIDDDYFTDNETLKEEKKEKENTIILNNNKNNINFGNENLEIVTENMGEPFVDINEMEGVSEVLITEETLEIVNFGMDNSIVEVDPEKLEQMAALFNEEKKPIIGSIEKQIFEEKEIIKEQNDSKEDEIKSLFK